MVIFGYHHGVYLCHHFFTGIIISNTRSKDDIIFVESFQLSRLSRYGTGITAAYFYHKNECKWSTISITSSCGIWGGGGGGSHKEKHSCFLSLT